MNISCQNQVCKISNEVDISFSVYKSIDSNSEKAIVLIHGLGGDSSAWQPIAEKLTSFKFTVIAIDLRGHGLSSRPVNPNDYELQEFAQDLRLLLTHLEVSQAHFVGHCFGAMVAMKFANAHPYMVNSLTLINVSALPFAKLRLVSRARERLAANLIKIGRQLPKRHRIGYPDFTRFAGSSTFNLFRFYSDVSHMSLKSYFYILSTIIKFDGRELLSDFSSPVLVIAGEVDAISTVQESVELQQAVSGSELRVIPKGNHISVVNYPQQLSQYILEFLN